MKKMFHKFNKTAIISLSVVVVSVIAGMGINIVFAAWTAPSSNPPLGDIAAPINISAADQYKLGDLRLGSANSAEGYKLYVEGETLSEGSILPAKNGNYTLGTATLDNAAHNTWSQLWLKSDPGDFSTGIRFDVQQPIGVGIIFNDNKFKFIKGPTLATIGHYETTFEDATVTTRGGLNIDTNTLTVDATNNRVGVGTVTPDFAVDIDSGDLNVANGRVIIGTNSMPGTSSTLYVGRSSAPVSTDHAIEAYGTGSGATIYGVHSTNYYAGVEGYNNVGYGVRGMTDSSVYPGVGGLNSSYYQGTAEYAPGIKGKNLYEFGSGTFGTATNHARTAGVMGYTGNTNRTRGYVDTYGVVAKAGTASANSAAEHITSYGLYAIEGTEEFGGVSYAGYFSGDVHVTGDLTTSYGSNVGIGTPASEYVLDIYGQGYSNDPVKIRGAGAGSTIAYYSSDNIWAGVTGYSNEDAYRGFGVASGTDIDSNPEDLIFYTGSLVSGWGTERMRIQGATGEVQIKGNLSVNSGNVNPSYLQIDSIGTAPAAGDCDTAEEVGRMVFDSANNLLYVCKFAGWGSTAL